MAWFLSNGAWRREGIPAGKAAAPSASASQAIGPRQVHQRLPGYVPTPLHDWPALARELGVASIRVKDESSRLGLPAYKVLGASWATYRLLGQVLGRAPEPWDDVAGLRELASAAGPRVLVTASDGNHGRAVARVARWLGWQAAIFLPAGTAQARLDAIRDEGATVVEVEGTYDAAVEAAARLAGAPANGGSGTAGHLLVQDQGWEGYGEVPAWVAEGYATIFDEVDEQLAREGALPPTHVIVQIGVGTLAGAAACHYAGATSRLRATIIGVEPTGAACTFRSVEAGAPVMLEAGAHASIMAGLNCGTPSLAAWPALLHGVAGYVAVEDEDARQAMRRYRDIGLAVGESGAAGLAGLLALASPAGAGLHRHAGIDAASRILLLVTEGVTDPAAWAAMTGTQPGASGATSPPRDPL